MHLECRFRMDEPFALEMETSFGDGVTAVFGPSGAGKTTLLHLLAGVVRPREGRLVLDGEMLVDTASAVFRSAHQRRIGLVFQEGRLFPHLDVRQNLIFGRPKEPRFTFEHVVDALELADLLKRRPATLSGGERQRVALGRAILAEPRVLLLDEPLAALDRGRKRHILSLLRRSRDLFDVPMIYVSHDLSELLQLTEQMVLVDQGRVLGQGAFQNLVCQAQHLDLFHDLGMLNVTALSVAYHDGGLTAWRMGDHLLYGPKSNASEIHVSVRPEDIALVRKPVSDISVRNQIQGRIERLVVGEHRALCVVRADHSWLVEIAPDTVNAMNLAVDQDVWLLIKAQAVRYLD